MRNRHAAVLITLLALVVVALPARAEETKTRFHVGVRTQIDQWTVSVKEYGHIRGNGYWDPDKIAQKESEVGFLVGPELAISRGSWFIRGFHLQGTSDLSDSHSASDNTDKGERKLTGVDVGYGTIVGPFLGYRNIKVSFPDRQSADLTDQSISDVVIGLFLDTLRDTPGLGVRFEMLCSIPALLKASDDDAFHEEKFIGNADLSVAYRFKKMPLTMSAGYGIWAFEAPVREYTPSSTLITDKVLVRQESWSHGGTVKLSYGF